MMKMKDIMLFGSDIRIASEVKFTLGMMRN